MTFNPISVDFQFQCKMGFWYIDSELKRIYLSEYLRETLNIEDSWVSYGKFLRMIHRNLFKSFTTHFRNPIESLYIDSIVPIKHNQEELLFRILKNQDSDTTIKYGTAYLLKNNVNARYEQLGLSTENPHLILTHLFPNSNDTINSLIASLCDFNNVGILIYKKNNSEHYCNSHWKINNNIENLNWEEGIKLRFSLLHPDDRSHFYILLDRLYSRKISQFTYEYRICNTVYDLKKYQWVRSHFYNNIFEDDNQTIVEFNIDITKEKNHEDKLANIERKAHEVDKMKSHFIANISHEIRTPLNVILGLSDVICDCDSQTEKDEYVRLIRKNNHQLLGLVDDIIRVSQIETEQFYINTSTFNLIDLIKDIIKRVSMRIPEDIDFKFIPQDDECFLFHDKDKLTTILVNLITNATRFTEKGSITLKYRLFNNSLRISVDDTGIGMTHEQMQIIFNRFVKLNSFSPGNGLGLYICKQLVRKMGGDIGVRSTVGVGSTFWFRIPLIPNAIPAL